ncbi:MAG: hypothetical protein LKJ90_07845 [Faecalibacterium sp.]|nr:hypothetical protein [Faecalibacterium sp.]
MGFFRKPICGQTIAPACAYCVHGQPAVDPRMILCKKRGVVTPESHCRSYQYDPLLRIPKRQPKLPGFSPKDFSLEE